MSSVARVKIEVQAASARAAAEQGAASALGGREGLDAEGEQRLLSQLVRAADRAQVGRERVRRVVERVPSGSAEPAPHDASAASKAEREEAKRLKEEERQRLQKVATVGKAVLATVGAGSLARMVPMGETVMMVAEVVAQAIPLVEATIVKSLPKWLPSEVRESIKAAGSMAETAVVTPLARTAAMTAALGLARQAAAGASLVQGALEIATADLLGRSIGQVEGARGMAERFLGGVDIRESVEGVGFGALLGPLRAGLQPLMDLAVEDVGKRLRK